MTVTEARDIVFDGPLGPAMTWLHDKGYRFELIDGALVVTALPTVRHQEILAQLLVQLRAAAPSGWLTLWGRGCAYQEGSWLDPDLSVLAPGRSGTETVAPALAVEARSPSTWRCDEGRKMEIYRDGGVGAYWLVDPDEPRLRILELADGQYGEVASVGPGESVTRALPYPVTVTTPVWET